MAAFNPRAPSVKRIMQELRELSNDDNPDILAEALEENIFEWHFAVRGAWDTEFEGGVYHGRILMPAEYPFKPPAFVMLTPSGRFETGTKICLSISSHHPESWQPSWSVRSALVALIAFMQTPGSGAVGSLDHPPSVRRQLAAESRDRPPAYGNAVRQELITRMHERMLELEPRSRALYKQDTGAQAAAAADDALEAQAHTAVTQAPADPSAVAAEPALAQAEVSQQVAAAAAPPSQTTPQAAETLLNPLLEPRRQEEQQRQEPVAAAEAVVPHQQAAHQRQSWEDRGLTYLALLLGVLIVALLIRKVLVANPFKGEQELFGIDHVAIAQDVEL